MSKQRTLLALAALSVSLPLQAAEKAPNPDRIANTVVLKDIEVKNLGIETQEIGPADFEETVFSLGRIEAIPSKRAVVSSRIPGRIIKMEAFEGDTVAEGQAVVTIESRQPGNPPPSTTLPAPIGGLVMKTHSSLGEPIETDTDILEIIDLSEVFAVARVPEDIAGKLAIGSSARIVIPAVPDQTFRGEMLRFGTAADRASGTIDALFVLKGLAGQIRPNMRAEFSIILHRREGVTSVPKEAVQGDNVAPFVFVKDFELTNTFIKAPVVLGARNDRYVEIVSGLFPSDEVVTKGAYPLAFAGTGSVSLKEKLDADHGHPHNEDGSIMTAEQIAAEEAAKGGGGGLNSDPLTIFLAILSGLLIVLLVMSVLSRRAPVSEEVGGDA